MKPVVILGGTLRKLYFIKNFRLESGRMKLFNEPESESALSFFEIHFLLKLNFCKKSCIEQIMYGTVIINIVDRYSFNVD